MYVRVGGGPGLLLGRAAQLAADGLSAAHPGLVGLVQGDGAVGGGAEVLEERLGQAHQRDLLLEEARVREERRLLGELRVVRLDERNSFGPVKP